MNMKIELEKDSPSRWQHVLAWVYGLLVKFRHWLYHSKILESKSLPVPVVSIGNLTVGGTGKTPAVILIAGILRDKGVRTAVLSRGYKGRGQERVNVVSDGREVLLGPSQAGDEAYLMAQNLPGVPVLSGRDRYSLSRYAIEHFNTEALVLDDGFQHLRLARDLNLLLLDAADPWGNGCLVPAGPLREPMAEARRATAFLITRAEQRPGRLIEFLEHEFPGRPVFTARHRPVRLNALEGGQEREPEYLAGRRLLAFCGLAKPMTFLETLTRLGAEVAVFFKWPDHYQPQSRDLLLIEAKAIELGVTEAVTTAKDAVKLAGRSLGRELGQRLDVWVLNVEMEVLDRGEEFEALLPPGDQQSHQ